MNETYQLAKEYYLSLRSERYKLSDYSCCNIAIEKYMGALWLRFLKDIWEKDLDICSYHYFCPAEQDFYETKDKNQMFPLLSGGNFYTREDIDYGESMIYELLYELFNNSDTWHVDYFLADINYIYKNFYIYRR